MTILLGRGTGAHRKKYLGFVSKWCMLLTVQYPIRRVPAVQGLREAGEPGFWGESILEAQSPLERQPVS